MKDRKKKLLVFPKPRREPAASPIICQIGGPAVVLAHGAGGTYMSWWQQVPVLSQKFGCITIDHPRDAVAADLHRGRTGRDCRHLKIDLCRADVIDSREDAISR